MEVVRGAYRNWIFALVPSILGIGHRGIAAKFRGDRLNGLASGATTAMVTCLRSTFTMTAASTGFRFVRCGKRKGS
jgi:hypothetical protein